MQRRDSVYKGKVSSDMYTRNLTLEEALWVYEAYVPQHFARNEVKPIKNVKRMWNEGGYSCIGFFENEEASLKDITGYAFMSRNINIEHPKTVLLDYLALRHEYRGRGYGSELLKLLANQKDADYKAVLIETEDLDYAANDKERAERIRRDAFYTRGGVIKTNVKTLVYRARYANWYLPLGDTVLTDEEELEEITKIYDYMIPEGKRNLYFEGVIRK